MKEKILQKASEMFMVYGFKSVTMDDLASELGVSKKTIYEYFNNKSNLVAQVAEFVSDHIKAEIDYVMEQDYGPIEELFEIKKTVVSFFKDQKPSQQYQFQKYYPNVFAKLRASQVDRMENSLLANLEKGVKNGFYRKGLHRIFISRVYISGMMNLKDEVLFKETDLTPKELYEEFLSYHLRSIVTSKGLKRLNELENQLRND
ncbi:MAG: TetR/AcrR family transcriptional regulator [Bacteroidota bacterium]